MHPIVHSTAGAEDRPVPQYIIDLVGRVVLVGLETIRMIEQLPALNER